jgi:hypothetical protein
MCNDDLLLNSIFHETIDMCNDDLFNLESMEVGCDHYKKFELAFFSML